MIKGSAWRNNYEANKMFLVAGNFFKQEKNVYKYFVEYSRFKCVTDYAAREVERMREKGIEPLQFLRDMCDE